MRIKVGDYVVFKPLDQCNLRHNITPSMERTFDGGVHRVKCQEDYDDWFMIEDSHFFFCKSWIARKVQLEEITI